MKLLTTYILIFVILLTYSGLVQIYSSYENFGILALLSLLSAFAIPFFVKGYQFYLKKENESSGKNE